MKIFLPLLLLPSLAVATSCEVGGISAGPQSMECSISHHRVKKRLSLDCIKGRYVIRWEGKKYDVNNAYHEDVERGSSPLIFDAGRIILRAILVHENFLATLRISNREYRGQCFNQTED